jgi:hypothetical protein
MWKYRVDVQPMLIIQLLILLMLANGMPVVAKNILGDDFAYPIDGGVRFVDGHPLLGTSKTIRGILLSVLVTSVCAPFVGLDLKNGFLVGSGAMAGDLLSSFLKRRLNLPPSSRATGLDQIPESLIPLLACRNSLSLSGVDIAVTVAIFFVGEMLLSRLLYWIHVRDRPY